MKSIHKAYVKALAINLFFVPYEVIPTGSSGLAYIISYIFYNISQLI